jgi:hypothetical protein
LLQVYFQVIKGRILYPAVPDQSPQNDKTWGEDKKKKLFYELKKWRIFGM